MRIRPVRQRVAVRSEPRRAILPCFQNGFTLPGAFALRRSALALLPLLAMTAGCESLVDPYSRAGTWRPGGVNDRNLAVMAARPQEIARGTGAAGTTGFTAAAAVERLRTDRVKPLPDTGLARIVPVPTGSPGGGN